MAENEYPKTITVNGKPWTVSSKEHEKQVREQAKQAQSTEAVTDDQTITSNEETNQSQINQQPKTEQVLPEIKIDQEEPKNKKGLEAQHSWFKHPTADDMMKSDVETGENVVDFSAQSWDYSISKYLNDKYSWTKDDPEVKDISFETPYNIMAANEDVVVNIDGKKKKFRFIQHDHGGYNNPDPEKLNQFLEDIKIHIDREVDDGYEELTDKEILDAIPVNKFWFDNRDKNKADFSDALDLYQGIENEYVDQLGNSIYNQKKENFKYGTFKFSDGREISYKALWNMRTRMREANLFLNAKNRLKEKINQFGGESEYDDYLSSNSWQFFNKDDRRLYELDKFIETREERYGLVKDPDFGSKDDAIREREALITKLGYKPLLGEDGEFVKDKYGKPIYTTEKDGEQQVVEPELDWWYHENAEEISGLAHNSKRSDLLKGRRELSTQLIEMANILFENKDEVSDEIAWWKKASGLYPLDMNQDSYNNDIQAIQRITETDDFFNLLDYEFEPGQSQNAVDKFIFGKEELPHHVVPTEIAGKSAVAHRFNDILRKYKTYNRAIELNSRLEDLPQEGIWHELMDKVNQSLFQTNLGGDEMTRDQTDEVFKQILKDDLGVVEDLDQYKGSTGRRIVEGVSDVGAGMLPILIEVGILMTPMRGAVARGKLVQWGHRLTQGSGFATRHAVNTILIPSIATTLEWSAAEGLGELVTGGAWKGHTVHYNRETESFEINPITPMAFGIGTSITRAFNRHMWDKAVNSYKPIVTTARYLNQASETSLGRIVLPPIEAASGGATAAVTLNFAEAVNLLIKEGQITDENFKNLTDLEQLLYTASFFSMMKGREMFSLRGAKAIVDKTIWDIDPRQQIYLSAAKRLKIKANKNDQYLNEGGLKELEKKLIEDVKNNKKLSEKQKTKQILQIKEDIRNLRIYNQLIESKRNVLKDKIKSDDLNAKFVAEQLNAKFVAEQNKMSTMRRVQEGSETYEDMEALGKLTEAEYFEVLYRAGINPSSSIGLKLESYYDFLQNTVESANKLGGGKSAIGSPERMEFFYKNSQYYRNNNLIESWKKQVKEDESLKPVLEPKIKQLENTQKELLNNLVELLEKSAKDFGKQLEGEIKLKTILAERLGADIYKLNNTRFYQALRINARKKFKPKFDAIDKLTNPENKAKALKKLQLQIDNWIKKQKGATAFIRGNQIYINIDAMRDNRSNTELSHELLHFVFRKIFKTRKGNISKSGKEVIDLMVNNLIYKDRNTLEKAMEERGYKENGKVKNEVYDEYITVLGDLLKTGEIKKTKQLDNVFSKYFNGLYRHIAPNVGKQGYDNINITAKKGSKEYETQVKKSAKLLYDLIESFSTEKVTKEDILKFSDAQGDANIKYAASKSNIEGLINKYNGDISEMINKTLNKDKAGNDVTDLQNGIFGQQVAPIVNYLTNTLWNPIVNKGNLTTKDFKNEIITDIAMYVLTGLDVSKLKKGGQSLDSHVTQITIQRGQRKAEEMGVETSADLGGLGFKSEFSEEILDKIDSGEKTFDNIDGKKISNQIKTEQKTSTLLDQINLTGKLNESIDNAVKKIWGTELPQITSKEFLSTLEQHYITEAFKDVKNQLGTGDKYKNFHESNFDLLFDGIFVGDLVAMQKRGDNIFATKVVRLTNQRSIQNAIDVGLLAPSTLNKSAAGVEVFLKNGVKLELDWGQWKNIKPGDKGYTPEKAKKDQQLKEQLKKSYEEVVNKGRPELETWVEHFTGGDRIDGRKDALVKALVKVFSHQKAKELLKIENSEVFEKYESIKDLKNQTVAENELRQIIDLIDINPNIKFHKEPLNKGKENKKITESSERLEEGLKLVQLIGRNLHNVNSIFTKESIEKGKPELTDKYKDKFSDQAVMDAWEVYLSGKIRNAPEKILDALTKLVPPGSLRTKGLEQVIMNIFAKVPGFKTLQEFQTEKGGRPDVFGEWFGELLGIEVKAADAQIGSIQINKLNISTGEIVINKRKHYEDIEQFEKMVKESLDGYKDLKDFFNGICAEVTTDPVHKKVLEDYNMAGDPIPAWAYEMAKNNGFLKGITKTTVVNQKYVENHYLNSQKYKSQYIYLTGKGLFSVGENMGAFPNAPKLEADVLAVFRPDVHSVKSKYGKEHGLVYITPRITPKITNVEGKGVEILTKKQQQELVDPVSIKINENVKLSKDLSRAYENKRTIIKKYKNNPEGVEKVGVSVFDFDATIAHSENYVFAEKGGKKKKISAEEWPFIGETLAAEGWKFDFSDFNKVTRGKPAEYFEKMRERIVEYGPENVFILTARAPQSQKAIHDWLKSNGIDIPLKNITGLGDSTGEAKAKWMLEKVAEGYNDLYFVDDARPNFEAVRKVLKEFDVDSYIIKADGEIKFSKDNNKNFNKILEKRSDIKAEDIITRQEAVTKGKDKWFNEIIPASAQDFRGLLYRLLGKGKEGEAEMEFFKEALLDPYSKGYQALNGIKNRISSEYSKLLKDSKIDLRKKVEGTDFTTDMAVRMYLWNKNGLKVEGVDPYQQKVLTEFVKSNPKLLDFANKLGAISRAKNGYVEPGKYWMVESIGSDLKNLVNGELRNEALGEWIKNKNEIFSENNLNKIELIYGPSYRKALENILYRMESGHNRMTGTDPDVNRFYDWINGSVGATMFFNTRSAVLQTMSTVNFIYWSDNNVFAAAKAFANQKQYWKDFAFIFNSPTLKQRRAGMEIDVSASELTNVFEKAGNNPKAIFKYLINLGFTPTRIADSFAIASGGASMYRNRINKYIKEGKSKADAEKQAWLDFQEISEQTQQSSRPDLISAQQAGPLGRLVLAWQNTPMQYTRLTEKAFKDIKNGRGDTKTNVSKIIYYGAMQNIMFSSLQQGLMWTMFGDDQEKIKDGELRVLNNTFDTFLRGTGVYGAGVATLKNTLIQWDAQKDKPYGQDSPEKVVIEALSLSPPIGSKTRKLVNAYNTFKYNEGVGDELGFRIENPNFHALGNIIEATTNLPVARTLNKANNLEEAITGNHELWQRSALILGWNRWNLGVEDQELEEAKQRAKDKRKEEKKKIKEQKKIEEKKAEEERKKKEGIKTVTCSGTRSDGQPCKLTTETKADTWLCPHHAEFKDGSDRDGDGIKEYQCTATTGSGSRCKNKTENKNKKCYAHQ